MTLRFTSIGVALVAASICLFAVPAYAQTALARYAIVVQGTSGEETYATQHRKWLDDLVRILRDSFHYDAAHLTVLAEIPTQGEVKATAENVKTVLGGLAKAAKSGDQVFVMLIGHGGGDAAEAKFNLVGPDLSVAEWNALLTPIPARLVFVDATSSSFPFLKGLAGPGRVVITATRSYAERYHTVFPEKFIQAFATPGADLDKNGRISMWEAFAWASRQVADYFDQEGHLATEHAMLDDKGDGVGRDSSAAAAGATLASLTYLDAPAETRVADPEVQAMITRRDALARQVDELRVRRPTMPAVEFDQEFEKLIIDLATVSRDIRRRSGGNT